MNFGVDFDVYNRKLYGSIDLYRKHSKELIATVDLPSTLGVSRGTFNVGEMMNKGIEMNLYSDWELPGGVKYTSNLVFSHNNSEVTSLNIAFMFPRSIPSFSYVEGYAYRPAFSFG